MVLRDINSVQSVKEEAVTISQSRSRIQIQDGLAASEPESTDGRAFYFVFPQFWEIRAAWHRHEEGRLLGKR